uniref:Uncharacterized protein n=1 Tax=Anguilla anguilla TaxID=7936 RepID=A0A0E9R261_ANGAN
MPFTNSLICKHTHVCKQAVLSTITVDLTVLISHHRLV